MESIHFDVLGTPGPSGSKRALRHRHTGKIVLIDSGGKRTKAWRAAVAAAARSAMKAAKADGYIEAPIYLVIEFRMPRPKSHYRASGEIHPRAPWLPLGKPDLTKLLRSTEDALTGIVWEDDRFVCEVHASRSYASTGSAGARISAIHQRGRDGAGKTNEERERFFGDTRRLGDGDAVVATG